MIGDLTTLARLKGYLQDAPASSADAVLSRLITAASQFITTYTDRVFPLSSYVETRDGRGNQIMGMREFPVQTISLLTIDGVAIKARPALQTVSTSNDFSGYVFDEKMLMLDGYCFVRGFQNVHIEYTAGYQILNEQQTIPASGPYTVNTLWFWANDLGVKFVSSGVALTKVAAAPAAGQYTVSEGLFTFNVANAGIPVYVSYGTVPADIEECCIEICCERFKYRERIGINSKSIEGQNISFMRSDINDATKTVLTQYKRVGIAL